MFIQFIQFCCVANVFIAAKFFVVRPQKKTTLVFRNAGDEKSLHPGGRKKSFFD